MTSATPAPREPDRETGTRQGEPSTPPDRPHGQVNGAFYPSGDANNAADPADLGNAARADESADLGNAARADKSADLGADESADLGNAARADKSADLGADESADLGHPGQPSGHHGGQPGPWSIYIPPAALTAEPGPSGTAKSLTALAVAAVIAVLGLLLGWIWSAFAPWLPGVVESDGLFLQQPYGEQRAGQETWFILLSIGAGILFGIIAWVALRRFRGPLMVVALAVGGIAGGWIAWRFGHNIGRGHALAEARGGKIGQVVLIPPDLRIKQAGNIGLWHGWLPYLSGVLLYVAIAAIVTYLLIASFTASPALITRRPGRTGTPDPGSAQT